MNWNDLLTRFKQQPLFDAAKLAGFTDPDSKVKEQVVCWIHEKKLVKVHQWWCMIEKPWRETEIPLPVVANYVLHPSYLSVEWALQYYDMIPDFVPNPTSITICRRMLFSALDAIFIYHHVPVDFFHGHSQDKVDDFKINIACPEKALLDKIYIFLQANPFSLKWLEEIKLQNLDDFDLKKFKQLAEGMNNEALGEALNITSSYIRAQKRK